MLYLFYFYRFTRIPINAAKNTRDKCFEIVNRNFFFFIITKCYLLFIMKLNILLMNNYFFFMRKHALKNTLIKHVFKKWCDRSKHTL